MIFEILTTAGVFSWKTRTVASSSGERYPPLGNGCLLCMVAGIAAMGGPDIASAREITGGEKVRVAANAAAPRLVSMTLRIRVPSPRGEEDVEEEEYSPWLLLFLEAATVRSRGDCSER